ncbi:MAG: proline--tRNA ligase [Nanoarchaeota archaeon]|nr:proline--tRNA ligase [Nanoarchaeota archaeon]
MSAKKSETKEEVKKSEEAKAEHSRNLLGMNFKKSENFGEWYLEVIKKSDIVDERVPIKGFNVLMPEGYEIWHIMMDRLDAMLKKIGAQNYYFPLLIPERFLKREAEHFKGFNPETAWVTHAGETKLEERLAIRPTSETIMYEMFKLWIRSYQDLPLKVNQYTNIVRWDTKSTKPLIRDREFLWHETHSAHAIAEEAEKEVDEALKIYRSLITGLLGISYLEFARPEWDKFPGADYSVALDAVLPDGKLLQIGTVHNLGQNFSKPIEMVFLDSEGKKKYPYQLSYGVTTRLLGALIAIHGDDRGLILPPEVAPAQIAIVPIYTKETREKVLEKAGEIFGRLEKSYRVVLDDSEKTPGFKFHHHELKGVPLRIEIGPKDLEKKQVTLVRRDFLEKIPVEEENLERQITEAFDSIFLQLKKRSEENLMVTDAKDYDGLKANLNAGGFVRISFCMRETCADKIKADTKAEVRGTLFSIEEGVSGNCAVCGGKASARAYVARAY